MRIAGKNFMKGAAMLSCLVLANTAFAAGPPRPSSMSNSLAITLVVVAIALLLAIALMANVVLGAAQMRIEKEKEKSNTTAALAKTLTMLLFVLSSSTLFAQDAAAPAEAAAVTTSYGGLSATTFYMLVSVIGLELIVLVVLVAQLKTLLAKDKPVVQVVRTEAKPSLLRVWWEKANSFRPMHQEQEMDMGHDYDGIRELDNRLPAWWVYSFYACIIFSIVYVYRFHVSHTGPSSEQEYIAEMVIADAEKEAYLKKAANKVDENTVTLITDASALAEGKKLFGSSCAACHGADGGGIVGPNLTDDYWLHKGSVKDIFKTIKYGVPEKGMKSWKDDFSPVQIAQLTSYIKALQGSKPASPKEPQGELYQENSNASAIPDSTKLAAN